MFGFFGVVLGLVFYLYFVVVFVGVFFCLLWVGFFNDLWSLKSNSKCLPPPCFKSREYSFNKQLTTHSNFLLDHFYVFLPLTESLQCTHTPGFSFCQLQFSWKNLLAA